MMTKYTVMWHRIYSFHFFYLLCYSDWIRSYFNWIEMTSRSHSTQSEVGLFVSNVRREWVCCWLHKENSNNWTRNTLDTKQQRAENSGRCLYGGGIMGGGIMEAGQIRCFVAFMILLISNIDIYVFCCVVALLLEKEENINNF